MRSLYKMAALPVQMTGLLSDQVTRGVWRHLQVVHAGFTDSFTEASKFFVSKVDVVSSSAVIGANMGALDMVFGGGVSDSY